MIYIDKTGRLSEYCDVELAGIVQKIMLCIAIQDSSVQHEFTFSNKYDSEKAFDHLRKKGFKPVHVIKNTVLGMIFYVGVPFENLKTR